MLPIIQIEVPSYSLFATVGLVCAVLFSYFRIDKADISFKEFLICLGACAVCALSGARLLFVIAMMPQMGIEAGSIIYYLINGGVVFYGGLLGILIGVLIFTRIIHKEYDLVINTLTPAIPLFHVFGRMGCLFAGCCYGVPWTWGVVLQDSPGVIRFPVQLFESIINAAIFIIILLRERKRGKTEGNLRVYLLLYGGFRFVLEYLRDDNVRGIWIFGLSTAQIVSITIVLFYIFPKAKDIIKDCRKRLAEL